MNAPRRQVIETLREEALAGAVDVTEFMFRFYEKYGFSDDAPGSEWERYAEAYRYAMEHITPVLTPNEPIVGRRAPLAPEYLPEWEQNYRTNVERICREAGTGQDSHMAIDYGLLLSAGTEGVIKKIDGLLSQETDGEKAAFYRTARACMEAIGHHAEKYAEEAERVAATVEDPAGKENLRVVAAICRKVPKYPATSFREAVQSVHFLTHCVSFNPFRFCFQQYQLGHPDRYLWKYYEADLASGKIDREEAQFLLDCLGIQINFRVCNGLSCGYMVGGRDKNGVSVQNELTEMGMRVVEDIRLVYPSVGYCYTEDHDGKYLQTACRILAAGRSHPAIFNDDLITEGLRRYGVSEEEAHEYIHSTCVEITPVAASNAWVASPYTNMPGLLLQVMNEKDYDGFDELLAAFFATLDRKIAADHHDYNEARKVHRAKNMNPAVSCFVRDCLARGTDIERGGARYNWTMPSFVGIANLVDGLYAIKELVFVKKELSQEEYRAALADNFAHTEALRQHILNAIPKYGNDIDEVDALFGVITEHIVAECKKYHGFYTESRWIPSAFCWMRHERFGSETGATPDGRQAGFPLGDGSGPCQGREKNGPTASLLSSTKWCHRDLIGGVAVNIKFSKSTLGENSLSVMERLIRTYMQRGGFELQINVIDRETLIDARRRPELYRDLVVRIGGYSDYFVTLPDGMQEELILRTEHTI